MLQSLFQNLPSDKRLSLNVVKAAASDQKCMATGTSGVIKKLATIFSLGQTVSAMACTETPCTGHYYLPQTGPCGEHCGGNWYNKYFYSPSAYYDEGYYFTGEDECQFCMCKEDSCSNPPASSPFSTISVH